MKKLSENTKTKLKELGVGIVYLFGSRATGTALDSSDYDIGVVFAGSPKTSKGGFALFNDIYSTLNEDYPDYVVGPKLDISFLQNANAALEMSAINTGKVLFEIDPTFRANYEESVFGRYDDYCHLQKEYEDVTFRAFTK